MWWIKRETKGTLPSFTHLLPAPGGDRQKKVELRQRLLRHIGDPEPGELVMSASDPLHAVERVHQIAPPSGVERVQRTAASPAGFRSSQMSVREMANLINWIQCLG